MMASPQLSHLYPMLTTRVLSLRYQDYFSHIWPPLTFGALIFLLQCLTCIVKIKRSVHLYVVSHASKIYVFIPQHPIHHCELFDHLIKYSVGQT